MGASPQHGQERRGLRKPIISGSSSDSWHPIVPYIAALKEETPLPGEQKTREGEDAKRIGAF